MTESPQFVQKQFRVHTCYAPSTCLGDTMQFGDPYLQGKSDYIRGVPRDLNPLDRENETYGSPDWETWFEGWDDADAEWHKLESPEDEEAAN